MDRKATSRENVAETAVENGGGHVGANTQEIVDRLFDGGPVVQDRLLAVCPHADTLGSVEVGDAIAIIEGDHKKKMNF